MLSSVSSLSLSDAERVHTTASHMESSETQPAVQTYEASHSGLSTLLSWLCRKAEVSQTSL